MAGVVQETIAARLGEIRTFGTAAGGTALTTTVGCIALPRGASHAFITARNFSTAVVAQIAKNPYLVVLKTADSLATVIDYSEVAQDGDATTEVNLDAIDTAANGDYLYVGSHIPFRGVRVDVSADSNEANGTNSVIPVNYWNGAWTTTSATDGTISGSASLGTDGAVTWTVPTDWQKKSLVEIATPVPGTDWPLELRQYQTDQLYWTRWQWSVQLDVLVRVDAMLSLNRSTAYFELIANQTVEMRLQRGYMGDGCIEAKSDAGTGNLIVNGATYYGSLFS